VAATKGHRFLIRKESAANTTPSRNVAMTSRLPLSQWISANAAADSAG
jgi:hypothetical protein